MTVEVLRKRSNRILWSYSRRFERRTINAYEGNINVHRIESRFYDAIHPEIFNLTEQKRLLGKIDRVATLLESRHLNDLPVLDFGCGTGNVTGKLLDKRFKVVAADSSEEMINLVRRKFRPAIKSGQLQTQLLSMDHEVPSGTYSAAILFSVYHHLFDTLAYVRKISRVLPVGGILLIDHEVSDEYWRIRRTKLYHLFTLSSWALNKWDRSLHGVVIPDLDYTLSDVHTSESSRIKWDVELKGIAGLGFELQEMSFYLCRPTRLPNPSYVLLSRVISDSISLLFNRVVSSDEYKVPIAPRNATNA